jgi:hypothetical protein
LEGNQNNGETKPKWKNKALERDSAAKKHPTSHFGLASYLLLGPKPQIYE